MNPPIPPVFLTLQNAGATGGLSLVGRTQMARCHVITGRHLERIDEALTSLRSLLI